MATRGGEEGLGQTTGIIGGIRAGAGRRDSWMHCEEGCVGEERASWGVTED